MLEVTADYIPSEPGDEGGIVVWQSALNKLEFLESLDTKISEYTVWRAVKRGNLWTFYAKRDGQWELFDSAVLDAPMAGVSLKNGSTGGYMSLNVNEVVLCRSASITIGNVLPGNKVVLYDELQNAVDTKVVPTGYSGVEFILPSAIFKGTVKLFADQAAVSPIGEVGPVEFCGGDIYLYGFDIDVYWNGVELSKTGFTDLGKMYNGVIEEMLQVVNNADVDAFDVTLSIKQYLNEFVWQWADVAPDAGGTPGVYGDTIALGTLAPGESRDFWIRVEKADNMFIFKNEHFVIDIQHG
ncbi:phage protein [Desulfocucumis palustris]|uniref:Phage protein n=2 Tax=Desulfocucumis palustris TaxID=1898651 RepID=A0A2L2X9C8_9FIRM|nr:phage protein [Desulfocucumis palustris]